MTFALWLVEVMAEGVDLGFAGFDGLVGFKGCRAGTGAEDGAFFGGGGGGVLLLDLWSKLV